MYDETVDADDRVGGIKLGGILLLVGMEYCVPVVVTTVDGKTMTVVFSETDLYEVVADLDEDKLKKKNMFMMRSLGSFIRLNSGKCSLLRSSKNLNLP